MLKHRLSGSEAAGNRRRAALREREERVDDPLSGDKRLIYRESLLNRTGAAYRPFCEHRKLMHLAVVVDIFD